MGQRNVPFMNESKEIPPDMVGIEYITYENNFTREQAKQDYLDQVRLIDEE